jgi:uncharacterized protein with NRDE domain
MCTLVALDRCTRDAPLWIAANRDEYLDRPSDGPALRAGRDGALVVAPLDRRAGGTWWGVNRAGLFAAVTNRPSAAPDRSRRSRGQLVLDVLAAASAREAAAVAAALGPDLYNPFNLFAADGRDAFAVVYEGAPRLVALEPGVHVIGNVDPNAIEVGKIADTRARAQAVAQGPAEAIADGLAAILRSHDASGDPLAGVCVHRGGYGTRSSTRLRLGAERPWLSHADGPPCTTAYRDFSPLLAELGRTVGPRPGELAARIAS